MMKRTLVITLISVAIILGVASPSFGAYTTAVERNSITLKKLDSFLASKRYWRNNYTEKYNAVRYKTTEPLITQAADYKERVTLMSAQISRAGYLRSIYRSALLKYSYYLSKYGSRNSYTRYYADLAHKRSVTALNYVDPKYSKRLGIVIEDDPFTNLARTETQTDHKFKNFLWYMSIIEDFNVGSYGRTLAEWLYARGTVLQLSWEPRNPSGPSADQPEYKLSTIINGNHDAEIRRWAREIKDFGRTIYFRPMCEMNGDWTTWSGTANGNIPYEYKTAWKRIFNIFQQEGATNAKFIWSPNRDGNTSTAVNTFDVYYPGDRYVHYIGINGYNWGTLYDTPTWTSQWQTFDQIFGPSYKVYTALTTKQVIISEMGSTEVGGNKGLFIKDTMLKLKYNYPRITGAYWFNLNKETDWRIQSSTNSLNYFKAYAKYHQ